MTLKPRLTPRWLLTLTIVGVLYFVGAKLGLRLAFVNASATAVWPPTGIALAAVLLLGADVWPAIFVAAFLANLTTAGNLATSVCIAGGNTLEALAAGWLVTRFAGGRMPFERPENVFKFALLAAMVSTIISPTIGVTSLAVTGYADWEDYWRIWLTWFLGDAVGALVVTPPILLWSANPKLGWHGAKIVEIVALFASILVAGGVVFGGFFPSPVQNYPLEFLCIPPLLWAAFRFGPRKSATAILLIASIAVLGTLNGYGPFVRATHQESLFLLQLYAGVAAVTTMTLAAVVSERRVMESRLRELSTIDPHTGLANFRLFTERLGAERVRSMRTGSPFSLLFLDVDGLKRINDQFGHLAGSRALVRVADALRATCRAIDTPARYGGDEFAIILPETKADEARMIAERIHAALVRDSEVPPVRVSLGIATYPDDGDTAEALIHEADRTLYRMKQSGAVD